jgi:hypothetical protein
VFYGVETIARNARVQTVVFLEMLVRLLWRVCPGEGLPGDRRGTFALWVGRSALLLFLLLWL